MFNEIRQHPLLFAGVILFHVILAGLLVFSFDFQNPMPKPEQVNVVQATVVDASVLTQKQREKELAEQKKRQQELERQKQHEKQKREAEEAKRKKQAEEQRRKEEDAKRKQEAEQKRQQQEKQKREAEQKRKAEAERVRKEEQAKQEAERKRIAEEKRKADEKKRIEEQQRKEKEELKRQAELEKKRIAEEKRKAEEAARRAEEAERMRQQLAAEQQALADERARKVQSMLDRYRLLIGQKVETKWRKPPNTSDGLRCEVLVKIGPGGMVLTAQVVESSGNAVFDRSVEVAVRSAEPLPLPKDPSMFEHFREIRFVFNPQE